MKRPLAANLTANCNDMPDKTWRRVTQSSRASIFLSYIVQAIVITLSLYLGLDLGDRNLSVPFTFWGDALHFLLITKSIIENGEWWSSAMFSAPFGLNMLLFPAGGNIDYALIRALALFTDDPGLLLNAFWLLTFYLSAWSATWCMRTLGLSQAVSWVVGVLFAFLPHSFYRNVAHLMLVTYLVPFALTCAILVLSARWLDLSRARKAVLLVGCAFIGANYIYNAFFACFALFVAILGRLFARPARKEIAAAIGILGVVALVAFMSMLPTVIAWRHDEIAYDNVIGPNRPIADAEIYGLKIRHLLMPIDDHPFGVAREFTKRQVEANYPLENENGLSRIGTASSLGFLILLLLVVFGPVVPASRLKLSDHLVRSAGSLMIAFLLLSVIGGFGSLINLFVSPGIRAYNRVGPFIAFLSLFALGSLVETAVRLIRLGWPCRLLLTSLTPVIAIAGVFDQAPFDFLRYSRPFYEKKFETLDRFLYRIEATTAGDVYQLPYSPYPNAGNIERMQPEEHLAVAAVSHKLSWSYPPLSGRSVVFGRGMRFLDPMALVRRLAALDFVGIWVDGEGYADGGEGIVEQLAAAAQKPPLVSDDGRYRFVFLDKARTTLVQDLGIDGVERLQSYWMSRIDWDIPAIQMATAEGVRDAISGQVSSTGKAGTLVFGPYVPLPAGRYEVIWLGFAYEAPGAVHGYVDVTAGTRVFATEAMRLQAAADPDAEIEMCRLVFELPRPVVGLEFRMRVTDGLRVTLTRVLVRDLDAAPVAEPLITRISVAFSAGRSPSREMAQHQWRLEKTELYPNIQRLGLARFQIHPAVEHDAWLGLKVPDRAIPHTVILTMLLSLTERYPESFERSDGVVVEILKEQDRITSFDLYPRDQTRAVSQVLEGLEAGSTIWIRVGAKRNQLYDRLEIRELSLRSFQVQ